MDELEKQFGGGNNDSFSESLLTYSKQVNPEYFPPASIQSDLFSATVRSTFDSRPVNTVDTFGVNPVISVPNTQITPASAPIIFSYSVTVPTGRVYLLRDYLLIPTRLIYDENNNPIPDLFTVSFFVNGSPVSENTNLTFSSSGTGGFVPGFIVVGENSTIELIAKITNPLYLDIDPTFPVFISASIMMRFNALLSNNAPANFQVGNITDPKNSLTQSGNLNGLENQDDGMTFGRNTYFRGK